MTATERLIEAARKLRDEDALPPLVVDQQRAYAIYIERLQKNLDGLYRALDAVEAEMSEAEGTVRS